MSRRALYAGSFDPFTRGHLEIVQRALGVFDHLTIAVAENPAKKSFLTYPLKMMIIENDLREAGYDRQFTFNIVELKGLVGEYARQHEIRHMVRGIRVGADFDTEFMLNHVNRDLFPELETVFFMADHDGLTVSSSLVKELARHIFMSKIPDGVLLRYISPYALKVLRNQQYGLLHDKIPEWEDQKTKPCEDCGKPADRIVALPIGKPVPQPPYYCCTHCGHLQD